MSQDQASRALPPEPHTRGCVGGCSLPPAGGRGAGGRAERCLRAVEPVVRGPAIVVIAIVVFVASGAVDGRLGVALASAFVAFHASYCVLNFWLCRETHCVLTGAGWALLAVLGFAAALIPGDSMSWYRANVVTAGYLVVLGLGYAFEWTVAARTGRRALTRAEDIAPATARDRDHPDTGRQEIRHGHAQCHR